MKMPIAGCNCIWRTLARSLKNFTYVYLIKWRTQSTFQAFLGLFFRLLRSLSTLQSYFNHQTKYKPSLDCNMKWIWFFFTEHKYWVHSRYKNQRQMVLWFDFLSSQTLVVFFDAREYRGKALTLTQLALLIDWSGIVGVKPVLLCGQNLASHKLRISCSKKLNVCSPSIS